MAKGSAVAKRKADDATRGRLRSLDIALEDQGKQPHFLYDWTMMAGHAPLTPSEGVHQHPVGEPGGHHPTAAGLEDLL